MISSICTSTMISNSNSLCKERDAQSSARRLLHAITGFELSRVRTELQRRRILTTIPPHPVQPNRQPPSHRYLGNAFVSTHRQVQIPASPVGMDTCCRLGCFHQQEAQQRITLLADMSKSLLAST